MLICYHYSKTCVVPAAYQELAILPHVILPLLMS